MAWTETINFANDSMNARSRNSFARTYGYQEIINGQPNPESKAQFRARKIKDYIKEVTLADEQKLLLEAVAKPVVED